MIRGLNKLVASPGLGYVMSSYTKHTGGFQEAHEQAVQIAADFFAAGLVAFVPIAYGPAIERKLVNQVPLDPGDAAYFKSHDFWMPVCERFYSRCDYGVVAMTSNWYRSTGIAIELLALTRNRVPVHFYDPEEKQILNPGEVWRDWEEEMGALLDICAEEGGNLTLQELLPDQCEDLFQTVGEKVALKVEEEDGVDDD